MDAQFIRDIGNLLLGVIVLLFIVFTLIVEDSRRMKKNGKSIFKYDDTLDED